MKKDINVILFWGGIWGLVEATLGYVLHMIPISVGWCLWFPLAFFFMNKVYKHTEKPISVIYTSLLVAAIKFVNIMLPGSINRVVNPAVAIILEGTVVFIFYIIANKYRHTSEVRYLDTLGVSLAWRIFYIFYVLVMPLSIIKSSPVTEGTKALANFLALESLVNSIIIYFYMIVIPKIVRKYGKESSKDNRINLFRPVISLPLILIVVILQRML